MMGGELGFDEFYAASFRRLVGQLYAMTGSLIDAEDAVQEAYARAWQGWLARGRKAMAPYVSEFAEAQSGADRTRSTHHIEAGEE